MTDTRERIWAWEYGASAGDPQGMGEWYTDEVGLDGDEKEYVRADLYDAAIARAEAAEADLQSSQGQVADAMILAEKLENAEAERDKLRRLVELLDAQNEATAWGAAVGVRAEEIKGLCKALKQESD